MRHSLAKIILVISALALLSGCGASAEAWARARERDKRTAEATAPMRSLNDEARDAYLKSLTHPATRKLDQALALRGEAFDLSLALWLFAKEHNNSALDVDAGLKLVDDWRRELAAYGRAGMRESERLDTLRTFIHVDLGFGFDRSDPNGYRAHNLFMDGVASRRRGYCVTLSTVYLLLAPAIGLEAKGTYVPGHFGVLIKLDGEWKFIETTSRGRIRTKDSIEVKHRMSKASVDDHRVYLAPLRDREVVSALFNNLGALKLIARSGANSQKRASLLKEAEIALRRALELSERNTDATLNLAMALSEDGSPSKVRDALALTNKVLKWDSNSYNALVARASILDRFGDASIAKKDLARAKVLMSKRPDAWIIDGNIATREERFSDAKAHYEKALELDSSNFRALNNLAFVEERLGNKERARELAEKAKSVVEK